MLFYPCGDRCRRICSPFCRVCHGGKKKRSDGNCCSLNGRLQLNDRAFCIIQHDLRHFFGFAVAVLHLCNKVVKHLGPRIKHIEPARRRLRTEDDLHICQLFLIGQPLHFVAEFREYRRHLMGTFARDAVHIDAERGKCRRCFCLLRRQVGKRNTEFVHRLARLFRWSRKTHEPRTERCARLRRLDARICHDTREGGGLLH